MFASIDEAVEYWKDELSYVDDAKVTGSVGGYPVVEFTINKAAWGLVKDKKKFGRIVRSSEMEGGIEVGVSTCFYQTASLEWEPPVLRVCGYPEVINRILGKVMSDLPWNAPADT